MGVITQRLKKEVVSYEIVNQIVSFSCDGFDGTETLTVSSNYSADGDASLMHAQKENDESFLRPFFICIKDDVGNDIGISITSEDAVDLAKSLLAMANFINDKSKYTEVD